MAPDSGAGMSEEQAAFPIVDYARPQWMRNIGKFGIPLAMIQQDPCTVQAILANCIVLEVAHDWARGYISYVALHPDFKDAEHWASIPEYQFCCEIDQQGIITRRWATYALSHLVR
jgi:hypothetical protein